MTADKFRARTLRGLRRARHRGPAHPVPWEAQDNAAWIARVHGVPEVFDVVDPAAKRHEDAQRYARQSLRHAISPADCPL